MIKPNPFTPKSGEEPRIFLNRGEEIGFFKKKLEEGKQGRFNHYIINGEWGIGKTVLLKYLKIIAQQEGCLSAYFTAKEFERETNDAELSVHILQSTIKSLPIKFKEEGLFLRTIKGFGIQILGTGFNVNLEVDKGKIIDSQILLLDGLYSLWQDIKGKTDLVVVLIDDVQNFTQVSRIFTTLKNVLSSDTILKKTKFLFVLSSTLEGWEQFIVRNHPIGRYFIPRRELNSFNKKDTKKLILELLKGSGVSFSDRVVDLVYNYTGGHLFEIHSLCSSLYSAATHNLVDVKEWKIGFEQGLLYLGNAVFDSQLLGISEKEKETLHALSFFDEVTSFSTILEKTKKLKLAIKDVNKHLQRLVGKKLIQNPFRGHYFIKDKLFREYIKLKLK